MIDKTDLPANPAFINTWNDYRWKRAKNKAVTAAALEASLEQWHRLAADTEWSPVWVEVLVLVVEVFFLRLLLVTFSLFSTLPTTVHPTTQLQVQVWV